jgi:ATP-dependent DNA helicase 2 subunit 2
MRQGMSSMNCLSISCTHATQYEPFLNLGETCVTIARKFDAKSALALSSLVWALSELESYAVARIVTKDGKDPLLVLV